MANKAKKQAKASTGGIPRFILLVVVLMVALLALVACGADEIPTCEVDQGFWSKNLVIAVGEAHPDNDNFICTENGFKQYLSDPNPTNDPPADPVPPVDDPAPPSDPPTKPAGETVWSDPDAFDSTSAEYPLGDSMAWTYFQAWDGESVDTVVHVAVAPGLVLRVSDYVGTRYQIWGELPVERLSQMAKECQSRDSLPSVPEVIVINDLDDPALAELPDFWSLQPFPQ